jgi:hypothetical protein
MPLPYGERASKSRSGWSRHAADVCEGERLFAHRDAALVAHRSAVDRARHHVGLDIRVRVAEGKLGDALHLDAKGAQDDEEEERVDDGRQERTKHYLADCASARNRGNEHAHKRRPAVGN